jgi:cobaltochelatase CobN
VLGLAPDGTAELDLVLAILRAGQLFGGEQHLPGLRQALGLAEDGSDERGRVDDIEERPATCWRGCRPPAGTPSGSTS